MAEMILSANIFIASVEACLDVRFYVDTKSTYYFIRSNKFRTIKLKGETEERGQEKDEGRAPLIV